MGWGGLLRFVQVASLPPPTSQHVPMHQTKAWEDQGWVWKVGRGQVERVGHLPLRVAQPLVTLWPGTCPSSHSTRASCSACDASQGDGKCVCMYASVWVCGWGLGCVCLGVCGCARVHVCMQHECVFVDVCVGVGGG